MDKVADAQKSPTQPFMMQFLERVETEHISQEFSDHLTYAGDTGGRGPDYYTD